MSSYVICIVFCTFLLLQTFNVCSHIQVDSIPSSLGLNLHNCACCESERLQVTRSTLCSRETPTQVILQTVKTQMKCTMMLHFISQDEKDLQTKEYHIFLKNDNLTPQICTMDHPKCNVSNQNDECISI